MKRRTFNGFPFLAVSLSCGVAAAQQTPAIDLFNQAKLEFQQGNYAAACPHFEESYNLDKSPGTLYVLARCLENQGKPASALSRYNQFVQIFKYATAAQQSSHKTEFEEAANRILVLNNSVPRVTLKLPPNAPTDLVVSLDGAELPTSTVGQLRRLDPGTHTLAVDVPGRKQEAWDIVMQEGQTREEPIRIPEPLASTPPVSVPVKPQSLAVPDPTQTPWTRREVAMVTGGSVAMAGLIAGGVPFGIAMSKMSEVKAHCPNKVCDTLEWAQQARETQTLANISTIGAVLGGLGGALFFGALFAGGKTNTSKPRVEVGVWRLDSTGASFALKGAF